MRQTAGVYTAGGSTFTLLSKGSRKEAADNTKTKWRKGTLER